MWHDQGKWVTCRQYSILSSQYNLLANIKSYIWIHTPLQSDIWFKRYEQFFEFQNNVKHRNMSSVQAYNSKSILATSDSFSLIMSHMFVHFLFHLKKFYLSTFNITIAGDTNTDKVFRTDQPMYIAWGIGPINPAGHTAKHRQRAVGKNSGRTQ